MAGGARSIVFELIAHDNASRVFERVGAAAEHSAAEVGASQKKIAGSHAATATAASRAAGLVSKAGAGMAGGFALAAAASVKMAGDFQQQMTLLVTGAGETHDNIKKVSDGILKLAGDTGTSAEELAKGMYLIESASFHGADGLKVLKAAAQGAKADGAELHVVGDALTTVLTDMGLGGKNAAKGAAQASTLMSKMVAAVGAGKMRMDDFAGSIHNVLPNATAIGVKFDQVAAALATMTAQGISADQASQNLNHAIIHLTSPTLAQTKAMSRYGLSATDVAKNLGKRGLTGTLELLQQAVLKHMGPAGLTLTKAFNQSKEAAQGASKMYAQLPPAARKVADELKNGHTSLKDWTGDVKKLPAPMANLVKQWSTLHNTSKGFTEQLKSGRPDAQTYSGALRDLMGDSTGLQVALHLTGENMDTFKDNVKKVSKATADAKGNVKDWGDVQKNFNQKMAQFKEKIDALLISLGLKLIPILMDGIKFTQDHGTAVRNAGIAVGIFAGAVTAAWVGLKLYNGAMMIAKVATAVWTGAQWLLNAALDANPIGLVVVGLAALAAGLIYAYKHSETFRKIVNATWSAVASAATAMWDDAIKPVFRALMDGFLTVVGTIIHGAARAFGWVPGVGGKLKKAAKEFDKFKASVNTALDGIHDRQVSIKISDQTLASIRDLTGNTKLTTAQAARNVAKNTFATGGYTGHGGKHEPAGIVHRGEFVVPKEATSRLGVSFLGALSGLPGYATGGFVNIGGIPSTEASMRSDATYLNAGVGAAAQRIGNSVAAAVQAALGSSGGGVSHLHGGAGASLGGGMFRVVRGGRLNQGLHDQSTGFPAIDIGVPVGTPVYAAAAGRVAKSYDIRGFEPRRPGAQDGFRSYGRVIEIISQGFSTLYAHLSQRGVGAGAQVGGGQLIGLSGNTGNSTGPHLHFGARGTNPMRFFDSGGVLKPGLTLAYNGTGRGERVRTGRQEDALAVGIAQVELQGRRTVDAVESSAELTARALARELRRQNVRVEVGV